MTHGEQTPYQLERWACRLVGFSSDSYRNPPEEEHATLELRGKNIEIARVRRRFGYRRIHDLLRPKFPSADHKHVYRLYTEGSLTLLKRRKTKRPPLKRVPLQLARPINEVLSWAL